MHYYSFHIGDYVSHTRHLTLIEDLAYRRLLDLYYSSEKPIIAEQAARLIGMREHGQEVLCVLLEFFTETEVGYINKRADCEIDAFNKRSESARISASKRWNKDGSADAMRSHTEPNAPINHKPITNVITQDKPARAKKTAHALPDDFEPNEATVSLAKSLGISWQAELPKFRDHHLQKGTLGKDWNAGFRTWLNNGVKFGTAEKVSSIENEGGDPNEIIILPDGRRVTRAGLAMIKRFAA